MPPAHIIFRTNCPVCIYANFFVCCMIEVHTKTVPVFALDFKKCKSQKNDRAISFSNGAILPAAACWFSDISLSSPCENPSSDQCAPTSTTPAVAGGPAARRVDDKGIPAVLEQQLCRREFVVLSGPGSLLSPDNRRKPSNSGHCKNIKDTKKRSRCTISISRQRRCTSQQNCWPTSVLVLMAKVT